MNSQDAKARRQANTLPANGCAKGVTAHPSFDRQAEMGYIGTLIMAGRDPNYQSLIDDMLAAVRSNDCYDEAHVKLVEHIQSLHQTAKIDPTLLVDRLKVGGDYEAIGGSAYLSKIINSVPNVANGMYYARYHSRTPPASRLANGGLETAGGGGTYRS